MNSLSKMEMGQLKTERSHKSSRIIIRLQRGACEPISGILCGACGLCSTICGTCTGIITMLTTFLAALGGLAYLIYFLVTKFS